MKKELKEKLACPICKSELELRIDEEEDDEVKEGELHCPNCDNDYPIEDGIPNLLPPDFES
ncbi:MAG: Protein Trm112 family [Candidatus Methanohalarchaeum thermophilum]|uniref:Protein Trm112 family n=1 Tax=Methanohalarchaeum thermophilum TaxID=1903181 RepID=A0A1Q6DTL5_METT1|nr:MAG: Protein Trm112 family [Candidatus Methanohalarchaeum thermophilum]